MASLHGLPPLPKSLSALLNFSSSQWKELERMHAMRTMIQEDLSRPKVSLTERSFSKTKFQETHVETTEIAAPGGDGSSNDPQGSSRSRLDAQLALLRKEMVGLRQLDMSLLCQLWSLNESIQEYKHILGDADNSPGWENSLEYSASDDSALASSSPGHMTPFKGDLPSGGHRRRRRDLTSVPEHLSDSSSSSSFEFGDI